MARRGRGLPTIKLANQLLDEIDTVIQSRHPDKEYQDIKTLSKAFYYVNLALKHLQKVKY